MNYIATAMMKVKTCNIMHFTTRIPCRSMHSPTLETDINEVIHVGLSCGLSMVMGWVVSFHAGVVLGPNGIALLIE